MTNSTKFNLLAVFLAFVGMITLGGLGNAAVKVAHFYWFPFVINLGLYVVIAFKLYRNMKKLEKEGR